jgi:LuxR family transcriptional regulator, maltose regulon positive regulatory protein
MRGSGTRRSLTPCLDELVMRRQETGTAPGALQPRLEDLSTASAVNELAMADAAPPEVPTFAVMRTRLLTLLDLAVQQRLTIVVAPPGYGKTVLLAQWAASHSAGRVRWLTLTTKDNDPRRFAEDLRRTLLSTRPAPGHPSGAPADRAVDDARTNFISNTDLARLPPTVLVLDDLHLLSNMRLLNELATFIERAPRALHFVVATRADPPVDYYRLRLADALVELRQGDLAFTRDEAAKLIRRLAGRDLGVEQIYALFGRTEGWPVGLQLAALSLRERSDVDEFVATFAGDDRHVADYLAEEVLDRQPEPVRRFLLATSVLDRLSGPLCEFLTGDPGGQAMLEFLDRTSMFIVRLDAGRYWFRYHPLFCALLRHHLHDEAPSLERTLLRRAAEWHLARGNLDTGVSYLAEAQDWEAVIEAALVHGGALLAAGRAAVVAHWIERLPAPLRDQRIDLMLLEAGGLVFAGDTAAAREILHTVESSPSAALADRAVAHFLRSYASLRHGTPRTAVMTAELLLRELDSLEEADLPSVLGLTTRPADLASAASIIRGAALVLDGEFVEARRSLEPCVEADHPMWRLSALSSLSLLEAWSGRLTAGEQLGAQALSMERNLGAEQPATVWARLALAHIARERDELERAQVLLDDAEGQLAANPAHVLVTSLATERALVALATGDPASGLAILAARRFGEHPSVPHSILARRRAVEAQLQIMVGDLESAQRALELAPELETSDLVAGRVRLAIETGDLSTAGALAAAWPGGPEPRTGLLRGLWQAILDHLDGDEASASRRMISVVSAAEIEGNLGLFRGVGHHALGSLRGLYNAAPTPFLRAVVDRPLLEARVPLVRELVEQITEREYMVLNLLPTRLSNIEIADQLGVSLNTVKTHLKHIYRKLGVTGRSDAVAVAERHRLM